MEAHLSSKMDRILELLEPPKKKAAKSFEEEVEEFRREFRLKHLRKQIKGK